MKALPNFLSNPDPSLYHSSNYVYLDFETTNLEKGTALNPDNRIVLAVWNVENKIYYKWGGELEQQELVAACNKADFLVAHNAKFELQWLERCGYDIGSRPVFCTYAAEWVIGGNLYQHAALSLDACLERRGMGTKLKLVSRLIRDGDVCPSELPRPLLLKYGTADVRLGHELFRKQLEEMKGTRLLPVVYTRCLTIPPLADIETNGLHLDRERVEKEYNETLKDYRETMAELDAITGGINPRSPTQVATFVYGELGFEEKTDRQGKPIRNKPTKQFPEGVPKTGEEVLLSLRATTKEQRRFLELKKKQGGLAAALDKNLAMFYGACLENEGMIYAQLNQGTTVTHRLSSSGRRTYYRTFDAEKGAQFQNLPRKYKPLFSPRHEGWLFGEADGSQLEFRVAGHIGKDPVILEEILNDYDIHSFTASVMEDKPEEDISKKERTNAKADTFKPLIYSGLAW